MPGLHFFRRREIAAVAKWHAQPATESYIVHDATTTKCTVVDTKPTTATTTVVGNGLEPFVFSPATARSPSKKKGLHWRPFDVENGSRQL